MGILHFSILCSYLFLVVVDALFSRSSFTIKKKFQNLVVFWFYLGISYVILTYISQIFAYLVIQNWFSFTMGQILLVFCSLIATIFSFKIAFTGNSKKLPFQQ